MLIILNMIQINLKKITHTHSINLDPVKRQIYDDGGIEAIKSLIADAN